MVFLEGGEELVDELNYLWMILDRWGIKGLFLNRDFFKGGSKNKYVSCFDVNL